MMNPKVIGHLSQFFKDIASPAADKDLWALDGVTTEPVHLDEDGSVTEPVQAMWYPGPGLWGKIGYFFASPFKRWKRKQI
jgi:hypothetical protein